MPQHWRKSLLLLEQQLQTVLVQNVNSLTENHNFFVGESVRV